MSGGLKERRSWLRFSEPGRCPLARITLHYYFGDAGLEKLASFDGSTVAVYGGAAMVAAYVRNLGLLPTN
jgi:hypothetical protein